jgi:WbqC-like protein family
MKLGIMQPYFLPYLGHFALIKHTDRWIVFDTPQFIRRGWIDRNRILKPGAGGWQYIMVPLVKSPVATPIKEMKIRTNEPWQKKIFSQLLHYKKKAPYFKAVNGLLESGLEFSGNSITVLNVRLLKIICDYLGIHFNYALFSEMNINSAVRGPDDWALEICKALKADTYYNPPGGMEFYDRKKFETAGINLKFFKIDLQLYNQLGGPFEPGLSILDVMMFNPQEEINKMLDKYELI